MATLPTTLSEAIAGVDFSETTNGAQRIVLFGDDYVLKVDPGRQSNENELAWFRYAPEAVAPCAMIDDIDLDLEDTPLEFCSFLVMERAEWIGYSDECWDSDDYASCGCCPARSGVLEDLCPDDLHDGNVGTLYDGRFVAVDMGCCHPTTGDSGDWLARNQPVAYIRALADVFGVPFDAASNYHNHQ